MVWYSHLLKNFPQFVVIHTVKGFGVVNKAEVDVFLEFSCFFDDPTDVGTYFPANNHIVLYSHGEGNGTPLQYSCLENPIDGGAWWAAVSGFSQT